MGIWDHGDIWMELWDHGVKFTPQRYINCCIENDDETVDFMDFEGCQKKLSEQPTFPLDNIRLCFLQLFNHE